MTSTSSGVGPGQHVAGNRWDHLDVPALGAWTPHLTVTVILPAYDNAAALDLTLASLAAQTYPRDLIEVVVVDDGSDPPLDLPAAPHGLPVTLLRRPDEGFRLAAARNDGAAAARGEVLVFLDADMLCEPQHLEAHARWHHVCDHAVTLGARQHVEVDGIDAAAVLAAGRSGGLAPLFDGREVTGPAWLGPHMARTARLTSDHDDLFRVTTGGNLGLRAELFHAVGGFDASFTQWGSEDTDLGHRLFLAGALLVPADDAACWHQGAHHGLEAHERRSLDEQRARLSACVPHHGFRRAAPGRSFPVPAVVVEVVVVDTVDGTDAVVAPASSRASIVATVESVLASDLSDLEVLLILPEDHPDRARLSRELYADRRVVDGEQPDHARSPYRLRLPAGVLLAPDALRRIVTTVGIGTLDAGVVRVTVPGADGEVVAVATRAIGRARMVGADDPVADAGERFGSATLDGTAIGVRWAPSDRLARMAPFGAPPRPARRRSAAIDHVAPPGSITWLLADGPLGWERRGALAASVTEAEQRAADAVTSAEQRAADAEASDAELRAELADARHAAEMASARDARLRARRGVRVTTALTATGRTASITSLPRRLVRAMEPVELPPLPEPRTPTAVPAEPSASEPAAPGTVASGPGASGPGASGPGASGPAASGPAASQPSRPAGAGAHAAEPTATSTPDTGELSPPSHRDALPHLRVLHLGPLARFTSLVTLLPLDPDGWREQLRDGADLLLVEPPPGRPGWDPLDGELATVLRVADELGVPTVRILTDVGDTTAPGRATLELVETGLAATTEAADTLPVSVDTTIFNPQGWRPDPPGAVAALLGADPSPAGARLLADLDPPVVRLHPTDLRTGHPAATDHISRMSGPDALTTALHRTGVLLDHDGWQQSSADRDRGWSAALACGTPVVTVVADPAAGSDRRPPGVVATTVDDVADTIHRLLIDPDLRERTSIAGRRWALSTASRRSALTAILRHLDIPVPPDPRVTVLLSTHRPGTLDHALGSVASQDLAGVDLSLVLHGPGFDRVDVGDRGLPLAGVVRAPARWNLGDCLNAGLDRATGDLVTKMDDDDHYGPTHLTDLVLAWRTSGAEVVGKRIEYVHLVERDVTVRRQPTRPETFRLHVGGPTLMAERTLLARYRFLRRPNRVDSTLYERVLADGGRVYATHSRDVVLARHGSEHRHAWDVDDASFLAEAAGTSPGLDLDLASSDPAAARRGEDPAADRPTDPDDAR